MKLRLVKIIVDAEKVAEAREILENHGEDPQWTVALDDGRVLIEVILPATGNEPVLNEMEEVLGGSEGFRLLFLPLEATVPRIEKPQKEKDAVGPAVEDEKPARVHSRINREELYSDLADGARATPHYILMVALSAVVASAGLVMGDGAVIIGAMVIAPLIGPSMGAALATTLGDVKLGRASIWASFVGMSTVFVLSAIFGVFLEVDPFGDEIFGRTRLTYEHLALALAAGAAGAVSLTIGVGAALVGVMVAVALLPPLAVAGLLIGAGHFELGWGALVLVAGNVVGVSIAATVTFLIKGVRPNTWWEGRARRHALWTAGIAWGLLFVGLVLVVWLVWGGEHPRLPSLPD